MLSFNRRFIFLALVVIALALIIGAGLGLLVNHRPAAPRTAAPAVDYIDELLSQGRTQEVKELMEAYGRAKSANHNAYLESKGLK